MNPKKLSAGTFAVVLAAGAAVVGIAPTAFGPPDTLHVSTTGHDNSDCTVTACATVGWALSHAVAGEIIEIEPGTYLESAAPDVAVHTANIVDLAGLTIEPDVAAGRIERVNTIINATGEQYGLAIVADDVTVTGLTIEHAGASGVIVAPEGGRPHLRRPPPSA